MSDRWPQQAKMLSRNHKSQKACLYPLRSEGISVHNAQLLLAQPGLGTVAKGLLYDNYGGGGFMAELASQRPGGQEWPEDASGTPQARVPWPVAKTEETSLRTEAEKISDRKGGSTEIKQH